MVKGRCFIKVRGCAFLCNNNWVEGEGAESSSARTMRRRLTKGTELQTHRDTAAQRHSFTWVHGYRETDLETYRQRDILTYTKTQRWKDRAKGTAERERERE